MENFLFEIIASLGGGALVTGLSFAWFGRKIVERQIEKSAEKSKAKIEAEFDRISKIQEKEFQVFPEIWNKLLNTIGGIAYIANPIKEFPDINRMTSEELEEQLQKKDWPKNIKDEIKNSADKNSTYILWAMKKSVIETEKLLSDFHNLFLFNKIFLTEKMGMCLEEIDGLCTEAVSYAKVAISEIGIDYEMLRDVNKIVHEKLEPKKVELSKMIQNRLHFHNVS